MTWIDFAVLIVYFVVMVAIGIWSMRRVKGQEDYFMGGRGFGKLLQTFAAFGAGTGAHEPVTVGRTGWTSGVSGVWSALMWLFVTPVYWVVAVWYRRMRHLTLGDWFVERYDSRALGVAYTAFAMVFYMFFLSTMFSAVAKFSVPLIGFESYAGLDIKFFLIPLIAVIVILYGVLGGLTAAYYTDLIQGVFIIVLSILLIPFGLKALVAKFGDPETQGIMAGFAIMHDRVPADYFSLFSGPSAGEFPVQYIVSLTLLALVGIVVQPHFIATGGGSAKSEDEARIGLVVGNFLKRLCTVGWALTALIALALLAGNAEIAADPDRVWGVAAREILGPLNMGLVGLMLACLLAAMMSSADTYMIVTSALVTRNVFVAYISPDADEKSCLRVARVTGLLIIVGASVIALTMADVFGQFKLAIELPILFAAPFWVGMFWRRANVRAVWATIAFSVVFFFVLPYALPVVMPSLRTDSELSKSTLLVTTTTRRMATAADVAKHQAWVKAVEQAKQRKDDALIERMGAEPPLAVVGQEIEVVMKSGGKAIYWRDGVEPVGEVTLMKTETMTDEGKAKIETETYSSPHRGVGAFNVDFLLYHWLGIDLSGASKATIESLRLPPRLLLPFVVLILVSLVTRRDNAEVLDRYYAKMRTEVDPDPQVDQKKLAAAYADPKSLEHLRWFPGSDWEFGKPSRKDSVGFLVSVGVCALVIGLMVWLAGIGG
ncbi:MAG: sodium:solute symporter family protein [Verrucomicrobiales bacterium]|nr:sodium:solute symporter family protein [Verrucomicrobiales bacterium]